LGRKYFFDERFFEEIDTEAKAYYLGFLAADGCIKKSGGRLKGIELAVKESDREVIDRLLMEIYPDAPENFIFYKEEHETMVKGKKARFRGTVRILLYSVGMAESLNQKGIGEKKTWRLGKVGGIPDELFHHFLRGVIDGDGCIGCYRGKGNGYDYTIQIAGTKNFLEFIGEKVEELYGMDNYRIGYMKGSNIYRLEFYMDSILKLIPILYEGATIYLSRKREKAMEILAVRKEQERCWRTRYIKLPNRGFRHSEGQLKLF